MLAKAQAPRQYCLYSAMKSTSPHERLEPLLAMLPAAKHLGAQTPAPAYLEGLLCAAICMELATEPVRILDIHWGEDWAEALMEQDLLDEFMTWLEERWQSLRETLDPDQLRENPDALPLADALDWAAHDCPGNGPASSMPDAAGQWAGGFLLGAGQHSSDEAASELLEVIAALALEGKALQDYLRRAYEQPNQLGASVLVDDALFAAQDLRLALHKPPMP